MLWVDQMKSQSFAGCFLAGAFLLVFTLDRVNAAEPPVAELIRKLQLREAGIRQLGIKATVEYGTLPSLARDQGEDDEAFLLRNVSRELQPSGISAPVATSRDFDTAVVHLRFGEHLKSTPKFEEQLFDGHSTTRLLGTGTSEVQAIITGSRDPRLAETSEAFPRIDLLTFRPIDDRPFSSLLQEVSNWTAIEIPSGWKGDSPIDLSRLADPSGRPLFKLTEIKKSEQTVWSAVFRYSRPFVDEPPIRGEKAKTFRFGQPGTAQRLDWYRVDLISQDGELVISRIDNLPVVINRGTMPVATTLIEDYRSIDGVLVPHRIRCFRFRKDSIVASKLVVSDVTVNEQVSIPHQLEIPPDTAVRDFVTNRKYRTGLTEEMQDLRISQTAKELTSRATFNHRDNRFFWLVVANAAAVGLLISIPIIRRIVRTRQRDSGG